MKRMTVIECYSGKPNSPGSKDGKRDVALLSMNISHMSIDQHGNIYILEDHLTYYNLRRIDIHGTVTTFSIANAVFRNTKSTCGMCVGRDLFLYENRLASFNVVTKYNLDGLFTKNATEICHSSTKMGDRLTLEIDDINCLFACATGELLAAVGTFIVCISVDGEESMRYSEYDTFIKITAVVMDSDGSIFFSAQRSHDSDTVAKVVNTRVAIFIMSSETISNLTIAKDDRLYFSTFEWAYKEGLSPQRTASIVQLTRQRKTITDYNNVLEDTEYWDEKTLFTTKNTRVEKFVVDAIGLYMVCSNTALNWETCVSECCIQKVFFSMQWKKGKLYAYRLTCKKSTTDFLEQHRSESWLFSR